MLVSLAALFSSIHTLAAIFGAMSVTFAQVFYLEALKDGNIEVCERRYLRILFRGMRFGFIALVLASVALAITEYVLVVPAPHVLTVSFWVAQTLAVVLALTSIGLVKRAMHWEVGSALVFTAWWMLVMIDIVPSVPSAPYGAFVFAYAVASVFAFALLRVLRSVFGIKTSPQGYSAF